MESFLICLFLFVCLSHTTLAQSPQTLVNIRISFANNGTHTSFTLTSAQGGSLSNSWMAVGLNNAGQMVNLMFNKS